MRVAKMLKGAALGAGLGVGLGAAPASPLMRLKFEALGCASPGRTGGLRS